MRILLIPFIILLSLLSLAKPIGDDKLGCVMRVDEAAEKNLRKKTGESYVAYKSLRPCKITVSSKMGKCDDFSDCESPQVKSCYLVKEDGDKSFIGFDGEFEGIRLKENTEYVLEVDKFTASSNETILDRCTGGDESYNKYIVKRVISPASK